MTREPIPVSAEQRFFWPAVLFRLLYALPFALLLFLALAVSWYVFPGAVLGFVVAVWTETARRMRAEGIDPFALRQSPPQRTDLR